MKYSMAMHQRENFDFLETFLEHGYLASFPTETSLSHRGNHVSSLLYMFLFLFYLIWKLNFQKMTESYHSL